jgi:hypothetical protein
MAFCEIPSISSTITNTIIFQELFDAASILNSAILFTFWLSGWERLRLLFDFEVRRFWEFDLSFYYT